MTRTANSTDATTAAALADAFPGRFRSIIIRLQGVLRGRGADRKVYGNPLVHDVIFGGFHYDNLLNHSREDLARMNPVELVDEFDRRGIRAGNGDPITLADVCKAIADLDASFAKSLAGTNTSTVEHVYEPLVVDGVAVRGGKVYRCVASQGRKCHCRDCTGDKSAPVDGQIVISGLRIGRTVLEEAPNGPVPPSNSRADVVAKNIIRSRLPIGRYVSYRLEPGADYILRIGPAAAVAASKDGVTCDPAKVQAVKELLAG